MHRRRPQRANDSGETLVEVLVAVVILGIAGVAILAGLALSVKASDIHRKQTTGRAYARSYAEAIEKYVAGANPHYQPCAVADYYDPTRVGFDGDLPSGYTAAHTAAQPVLPDGAVAATCPGNDSGVQRIVVTVSSPDHRADESLTVLLRKPCGASMAVCS